MRHRIHVPLFGDPTQLGESEAIAAGEGRFRLVGRGTGERLQFKPGEIVECEIQALPTGKKGLVAVRSVSAEFRSRRNVYVVLGALVGAVFGMAFALFFKISTASALIGAALGASIFSVCSAVWGDSAWEILSQIVRRR